MATLSSSCSQSALTTVTSIAGPRMAAPARKVRFVSGMNSFAGLKATNGVISLGSPVTAEQWFAKIAGDLRAPGGGGATCNAALEIFRIAAIMNGLTLVGVAIGFVLLRMEAFVEESEI